MTVTAQDVVVCTNYPLLDRGLFFARMEAARSYLRWAAVSASIKPCFTSASSA